MSQLRNYFFGPLRVTRDDNSLLGFESGKTGGLLAYLVVEANRPHHREALAALLWPDQPDTAARQSLRQALYVVRRALGGDQGSENEEAHLVSGPLPSTLRSGAGAHTPILLVTRQTVQLNP